MGSCPSKSGGKTESEPDNDDPIKLNTLGEANSTADMSTNATPDGIDKDTATPEPDSKPDTTSVDKDTTDGLLEAVLSASADVTKDPDSTPNETAVDIPPPPSPPPVDVAVELAEDIPPPPSPPPVDEPSTLSSAGDIPPPPSPPPIENVPAPPNAPPIENVPAPPNAPPIENVPPPPSPPTIPDTNTKAESPEPTNSQVAEPKDTVINSDNTVQIHPSTDPREGNATIHETAAGASPPAPKLSTFGHPVTTNNTETSVETTNGSNVPHETAVTVASPAPKLSTFGTPILAADTESSPNADTAATNPDNDVTNTTQSPDSKSDAASLSKQDVKSSSPDVQADAKTPDVGEAVEIKLTLDDIPPPLLLSDDAVECNSLESAGETKKRLFGTEFDPEEDKDSKEKRSMVRFYILVIMATATFTLVAVAIALIVFINFADLRAIIGSRAGGGPTRRPPLLTDNVRIEGEIRMRNLNLSSLPSWTEESLEEHFINLTTKAFQNSTYRGLYDRTNVTGLSQGSVIVKFNVQLKPVVRTQSPTDVQEGNLYCNYKATTTFLQQALSGMKFDGSSGVNVLKLDLYVGSRMIFGASPTTNTPQLTQPSQTATSMLPTMYSSTATTTHQSSTMTSSPRLPSSSSTKMSTASVSPSSSSAATQTIKITRMTNTDTPTSSGSTYVPSTNEAQTMTVTDMTTAELVSTKPMSTMVTMKPTIDMVTTEMVKTSPMNATVMEMPTNDMTTAELTSTPSMSQTTSVMSTANTTMTNQSGLNTTNTTTVIRRPRETRQFTREPSTNPLVQRTTRYTHEMSSLGCSPHPLRSCVQAGWSRNTTRTPNRLHLWSETSQLVQIYTTLMQDVDLTSRHGVELHRVICSLLAPSCDDGLMGHNLPCRSACADFVHTLKDPIDAGALGALCNTSLPESESGSVCFQIHGQNSDTESTCSSGHCLNGGTCFDLSGQAYCRCSQEFGGDRCEIDPCTPNPCANGGTCLGRAELITSYACGCQAGYHGKHCESVDVLPTPLVPSEPVPSTIDVPSCIDVLPYSQYISDTKAPGWGTVKPLASCSSDAQLMFCAMAHPEFYHSPLFYHRRAPCRNICERVFRECDILFHALDRVFPGICEGLGTNQTEVEQFCTTN